MSQKRKTNSVFKLDFELKIQKQRSYLLFMRIILILTDSDFECKIRS